MMNRKLLLTGAAIIAAVTLLLNVPTSNETEYTPRANSEDIAPSMFNRDLRAVMNADPVTGVVDKQAYAELKEGFRAYEAAYVPTKASEDLIWTSAGPDNVGGRTRGITTHPDDPNTVYIGSVSGGLFKSTDGGSTWGLVEGFNVNSSISSVAILLNGHIYVATGTPFDSGRSSFAGDGLFVSTDNGVSFQRVQDFYPQESFSSTSDWSEIHAIIADKNVPNKLWIAWGDGLSTYTEGDSDVEFASSQLDGAPCRSLSMSNDGQTILAHIVNQGIFLSKDGGESWEIVSTSGTAFGKISMVSAARVELAVSPDSPDYMYAVVVNGGSRLQGAWGSTDAGVTWYQIANQSTGTSGFTPFYNGIFGQGIYDCALTVLPGQPEKIILGGIRLYMFTMVDENPIVGSWEQININFSFGPNPNFVHSDIHTFHWDANDKFYIGCDGGIFTSTNYANTYTPANFQYRSTQYYGIGYNGRGHLIGGTQDNGTHLITGFNGAPNNARRVLGGDGYDSEMSQVNEDFIIGSIYFNDVRRSFNGGLSFGALIDSTILPGPFYTTLLMHENRNVEETNETFRYITAEDEAYSAGSTITYASPNLQYELEYVTPDSVPPGDTLFLKVLNRTLLAIGGQNGEGFIISQDATKVGETPGFAFMNAPVIGTISAFAFSEDGDVLVTGSTNGRLYRVRGLRTAGTVEDIEALPVEYIGGGSTGYVADISIDPNNSERMVYSTAGYGTSNKVFITENLLDDASEVAFEGIWNMPAGLERMPAYGILIDKNDPDRIIAGTEYGTWVTTNEGATPWVECNMGMGRVPVFDLRQQLWENTNAQNPDILNEGAIYAGSHGRGMFYSGDYILSASDRANETMEDVREMTIFPNPMSTQGNVTFELRKNELAQLEVYDLSGRMVKAITSRGFNEGENTVAFDVSDLRAGNYLLTIRAGSSVVSEQFVVTR